MKFSVLIPVYNTEKYLEECLQSVLNQTYQDFEIVLVDDGSTDESGKICDKYQVDYPDKIKIIHKANQGLISARRVGIDNAHSDFCIFVDSDDSIRVNLLETVNEILSNNKDVDLLIYSLCYVRNSTVVKNARKLFDNGKVWTEQDKKELYKRIMFSDDINSMCTKAVKTSLLQSDTTDYTVYYDKNMGEDLLQSLYIITNAKKVMYIDTPLYCYNYNDNSISRGVSLESISKKSTLHIYNRILEYLPKWNLNSKENINKMNARWVSQAMYFLLKTLDSTVNIFFKRKVFDFCWDSMMPNCNIDLCKKHISKGFLEVYQLYVRNNSFKIYTYIAKRSFTNIYKKIKK